jgi:hypothetical protein
MTQRTYYNLLQLFNKYNIDISNKDDIRKTIILGNAKYRITKDLVIEVCSLTTNYIICSFPNINVLEQMILKNCTINNIFDMTIIIYNTDLYDPRKLYEYDIVFNGINYELTFNKLWYIECDNTQIIREIIEKDLLNYKIEKAICINYHH